MFSRSSAEEETLVEEPVADQDTTFIAVGHKFTGNTVSSGAIHLEGEIEGDVECKALTVGEKGRLNGVAIADDVVVGGRLDGSIRGIRVTLKPGCQVDGDIVYESLMIEHGAHFEGKSKRADNPTAKNAARKQADRKAPVSVAKSSSEGATNGKSKDPELVGAGK